MYEWCWRFGGTGPRAVVLILTSVFLHVKIPLRYLGYTLEWSLVLEHVCAGGGGVMWHYMVYTVPRDSFIVNISMHFWATVDVVWLDCQGDLMSPVRRGAGRALYEERLLSHSLCGDFS